MPPTQTHTTPAVGADCGATPNLVPGASLYGCDLSGLDLSGLDLSGANLAFANLSGTQLVGANLTDAYLVGANLTGANLTGANLTRAVLAGAILLGALFVNAWLLDTNFDFGPVPGSLGGGGGGGGGGGTACTGPYCAGYNEATVDTGDVMCSDQLGALTGGQLELHLSEQQLEDRGLRSTVTDSATSFQGAHFRFTTQDDSLTFFRGLGLANADFTNATFENFVLACRDVTGARFAGVSILGTPFASLVHVSFHDSDFSGSTFDNVELADVSFEGSDAETSVWTRIFAIVFEEPPVPGANDGIGLRMLNLDNVDFRGSTLGMGPTEPNGNGETTSRGLEFGGMRRGDDPKVVRHTSWQGADLRDATITDLRGEANVFAGALTDGLTVSGTGTVAGATFDAGWLGVDWTGTYDFTGATCPDGSIGSPINPCF